jgi:hypothetical protein
MILGIYTVFDKIAAECGPIFTAKNDGTAFRAFVNSISKVSDSDEFQLMELAKIDNETCVVTPLSPLRVVKGVGDEQGI